MEKSHCLAENISSLEVSGKLNINVQIIKNINDMGNLLEIKL